MRSIFVHLIGTSQEAVAARLSEMADPSGREWLFPSCVESKTVYLRFLEEAGLESELESQASLKSSLGRMPEVSVMADISGRIPGDAEVRHIVAFLLRHFRGVACDDYTTHCWTLDEIEADLHVQGHRFFDYEGWHRESEALRQHE